MNLHLQVDEKVEIFVDFVGILLHKLRQSLTLDIVHHDCPFAVDFRDLFEFGNVQTGFFHSGLIECLVEYVGLGVVFVENFYHLVAVAVDGLRVAYSNNFIGFHNCFPPYLP